MVEISRSLDVISMCVSFGLGTPLGIPKQVTGGLLHCLWRVETSTGIYALKVLNQEIRRGLRPSRTIYAQKGWHELPASTVFMLCRQKSWETIRGWNSMANTSWHLIGLMGAYCDMRNAPPNTAEALDGCCPSCTISIQIWSMWMQLRC